MLNVFNRFTKKELLNYLSMLFIGCILISNVLASKTFLFFNATLPGGIIIFPISYIVNDILSEIYGFKTTKRIIICGFIINLIAVVIYNISINLTSPAYAVELADAYKMVLSNTFRILAASFAAYLIGSLANAKVMVVMKAQNNNRLMLRCILSTLVGEGLDALIFSLVAFVGILSITELISMIIMQTLFKTIFEVIIYPVTKLFIQKINSLQD